MEQRERSANLPHVSGSKSQARAASKRASSRPIRVFISYAHKDSKQARLIAEGLRSGGTEPWLDLQELNPGENWPQAIGNAIEKSDAIVLLITAAFLRSPRFEEWNYAIGSKKHAGRVLPIIAPGTPDDSLPWILKRVHHLKAGSDWKRTGRRAADLLRQLDEEAS
jgi:hypothetical protein